MADKTARIQLPDGRIARFSVPADATEQEVLTHAENYFGRGVTRTPDYGPEPMSQSMAKAADAMGFGHSVIAGLGTRLMDFDARIRQLLGGDLSPQDVQQIQAGRTATGPVQAGRVGADMLVAGATAPATLAGNVAAGAAQRFLTDPVLPGESGAQNALEGGIGGGLGYGAVKALQGIVRPVTPSADVQKLASEGIIPTIGESAAATGTKVGRAVGKAEEAAGSFLPAVSAARERSGIKELGRAVFARATPKGMQVTDKIGREGLDETSRAISSRYDDALTAIGVVRPDNAFTQDINRRVGQAVVGLPKKAVTEVQEVIQDIIGGRQSPVAGAYTAEIAKRVDSDLGARIRDFRNSRDQSSRLMADALEEAQGAWRDLIRRNAPNQQVRDMLDDANRAWANLKRAERAVAKSGAIHGEFNATQLNQAVRETSSGGASKGQYARGKALMEDLSDPAKAVLSDRLPESGTAPRMLVGGLLTGALGGGAYANEQMGGPSFLTGLLAAGALSPLLYSRTASRYAIGDLIPGQNQAASFLSELAPYGGALGRVLYEQ